MLKLNTILTKKGFRRVIVSHGIQQWSKGNKSVLRHDSSSVLYRKTGVQHLELIENNNSRMYKYDDPEITTALYQFIGGTENA